MTERRLSRAELERALERCRADYEAAKAAVAEVGFICEGSLVERYTSCGNPNCRCAEPDGRHGPYYPAVLEGGRQDGLPSPVSRRRPPLCGVDRQPPPP